MRCVPDVDWSRRLPQVEALLGICPTPAVCLRRPEPPGWRVDSLVKACRSDLPRLSALSSLHPRLPSELLLARGHRRSAPGSPFLSFAIRLNHHALSTLRIFPLPGQCRGGI